VRVLGGTKDADFLYLTGCTQPGVVALLQKGTSGGSGSGIGSGSGSALRYTLVVPPEEGGAAHATWWGPRLTPAAATRFLGADEGAEHAQLPELLAEALRGARGGVLWDGGGSGASGGGAHESLLLDAPDGAPLPPGGAPRLAAAALRAAARSLGPQLAPRRAAPLSPLVARLRWRKSPAEASLLRASAAASAAGLFAAAGAARPGGGATEAAAAAAHEAHVRAAGAQRLAYPSVVGAGAAACAVHHNRYDGPLLEGDMLLMDAGCELGGYVSDVTRTWPLSRRFSPPQRALYDAVRAAHAACIAAVRPGATLASLHALAVRELSIGIEALGLVGGGTKSASHIARGPYFRFFPHALGHSLGLDTHDTPAVALSSPLAAGVVITVEPGLYIQPWATDVPDAFRGLGVRIEDDVLVTPTGAEVLSSGAPVDADAVEDWAAEAREEAAASAVAAAAWRRQRRQGP
jgi:Xaa-Pro aminopeptidase